MKRLIISLFTSILLLSCSRSAQEQDFVRYVNPRIGSGGHGHVFVGANVPFGFVQLGPTSIPQTWDWCSGYNAADSTIIGFSHTHLEGTGIGDLFDITLMPVTGQVTYSRGVEEDRDSGLWSYGLRSEEVVYPGYYCTTLTRYGIKAELTASQRTGLHRYTFPESDSSAIVLDLENGGCWDKTTGTKIEKIDSLNIEGYRFSTGWAKDQRLYFHISFSKPFSSAEITKRDEKGNPLYCRINFDKTSKGEQLLVKVGLSPVSERKAEVNMLTEIPAWDFDAQVAEAKSLWNKELSKIEISTENEDDKVIFYTALYHTMIQPSIFNDFDNSYMGADLVTRDGANFTNYTTFSLWDTYRAAMPLFTIIQKERMPDIINTMLKIYEQQGKLPVWHLMANETDCMVGNPGAIVVADAIVKGFEGFDTESAYSAITQSVMLNERGMDLRKKYGYIPCNLENEAIAKDMEYAIADGAVANAAQYLGKDEDSRFFRERSHSYRRYMDKTTLFARGKMSDGRWRSPFNPNIANHRENDYCEGNAWQYSWLAPQDFEGLVRFYGSREKLVERLDTLFDTSSELSGDNISPDITGMIGQYAHGNEPSHHIIYFYSMAGELRKAARRVRQVLRTMYRNDNDGLAGNEDVGQMSAWYILSSLGFYQVEPASTRFWFGSPLFDSAKIKVDDGYFTIIARNNSEENLCIRKARLNGKELNRNYIDFREIKAGNVLEFEMGK